ncbi:MAG: BamA/OMP85 family outer membrane protein [Bacillota bacterium]
MKRVAEIGLILLLVCTFFGTATFAQNGEEEGQIVGSIEIRGNNHISEEEIREQIELEPGDQLDREHLREDMQRIYELGYFQDVRVDPEVDSDGIRMVFRVIENPVLKEIKIEGNEVFSDETIREWLDLETGKILNSTRMNDNLENIMENFEKEGYSLAGIEDVQFEDKVLNIRVNPGRINDIILEGNEKTEDFVILRNLEIEEGEIFKMEDLEKSYQNLNELQYFEEINPEFSQAEDSDRVNVTLKVKETNTGEFGLSGGYQQKDGSGGWIGQIYVEEKNLMGRGQELSFNWDFGSETNYSLNFKEPWLMGTETSFSIGAYDRTREGTNSDNNDYTEHKRGGNVSLGHDLTEDWQGNVRFRLENTETSWADEEIEDEFGRTRSITLTGERDTTNHYLTPTSGGRDTLSVEYAGSVLGGDQDFTKYNLHVRRFLPGFREDHAWAFRMKVGASDGNLSFSERYKLGGANNLRGYDRLSFDGNEMMLFGAEYRFPIYEQINGVLFTDAGNTWETGKEMSVYDLNASVGAGVRLNTPMGILRLDYGFNEEREGNFHFSLGETF